MKFDQLDEELNKGIPVDGTVLLGSWIQVNSEWTPDRNGSYAAIYEEGDTDLLIVWSWWFTTATPGSPCIPGQTVLEEQGEFWSYSLPHALLNNVELELRTRYINNVFQFWVQALPAALSTIGAKHYPVGIEDEPDPGIEKILKEIQNWNEFLTL